MTQQLVYDFSQPPIRDPDYFFPLNLKLDPEEKANFINIAMIEHTAKFKGTGIGLSNVGNADDFFPKTIAQTNEFVKPLKLKVRKVTLFLSDGSQTSWVIHCDGVWYKQRPTILEARLSYYEIAEEPGAIRWWDNLSTTLKVHPANEYSQERINCQADVADLLREDKITWDKIPSPAFSVVTSAPSAILRTNRPHHVIQGPGLRVTISCQLVHDSDEDPFGVWEHIQRNIHLLGA
jgi:hypothetical protein